MKKIAIIPARGGSKRIPRKNIKEFLGKPIIAYSIEAAMASGLYEEVMVSTDDADIAEIALKFGAAVPFIRSEANSGDFATTIDVIFEVLEWYRENKAIHFELGTCIYACSPFVTPALLHSSIALLGDKSCTTVFPVIEFSHPIQRALILHDDRSIAPYDEGDWTKRTQDFGKAFHDAGMFYTFDTDKLYLLKKLISTESCGLKIDETRAQDIDSLVDWKLAELKYTLGRND